MKKWILFLGLFSTLISIGQVNLEWTARYDGLANWIDKAGDIAVDNQGNVYVTGESSSPFTGYNIATIKYNQTGNEEWVAIWTSTGSFNDKSYSIAVDNNSNVFVTGVVENDDIVTIKYDSNGNELWAKTYSDSADNHYYIKMKLTASNNIIISAVRSYWFRSKGLIFLKYNQNGNLLWDAAYGDNDSSNDYVFDFVMDNSENIYVTGLTNYYYNPINFLTYGGDVLALKYSSSGSLLWANNYDSPQNYYEGGSAISIDNNDNIYITGKQDNNTNTEVITLKYNSSGSRQWVKLYSQSPTSIDAGSKITVGQNQKIYVLGWTSNTPNGANLINLVYDVSGNLQWSKNYITPTNETASRPAAIVVDNFGNVYGCGFTHGMGGQHDVFIKAYDTQGNDLFEEIYNTTDSASEATMNMVIDNSSSLYLIVNSDTMGGGGRDLLTLKYSNLVGINDENQKKLTSFTLFPNPLTSTSTIYIDNIEHKEILIEFFSALGKSVKYIKTQQNEIKINHKDFTAGIYFYHLFTTKKTVGYGKLIVE